MNNLENYVLKNDLIQARIYLEGYNFYSIRAMRADQDRKLADEYLEKFQGLVARKREHDQIEALKDYIIKKGVTHIEHRGLTIHITHIQVRSN